MEIISYSAASKAAKSERSTRSETLAEGVEGTHANVKARIDHLEDSIQSVVKQADKMIINDAINIMKANAKLNAVAGSMRYKMHNMIFDDLLDLSGFDITQSNGYTHNSIEGSIIGGLVVTKEEVADSIPIKAILTVEEEGLGSYFITCDNGDTWQPIYPSMLCHFDEKIINLGNSIRIKAELSPSVKLLNYALTWA